MECLNANQIKSAYLRILQFNVIFVSYNVKNLKQFNM